MFSITEHHRHKLLLASNFS